MSIEESIAAIRERINTAASRVGRDPSEIALMAVSKTMPAERIREAIQAGHRLFGENRVQEFAGKRDAIFAGLPPATVAECSFHLIGHLQSNKAARAVELFSGLDSIDSLKLAERVNEQAGKMARKLPVLIEINIGEEPAKTGFAANSQEILPLLQASAKLQNLDIRGLMTVPPYTEDPEGARPFFQAIRRLRDHLRSETGLLLPELSIGMSHDFEIAIEEGSTCVRVGTAIFGARPKPAGDEAA